jgi:IS5 family transposase
LRIKKDTQGVLGFQKPTLKLTAQHYARYEGIDRILREEPAIVDLVHGDLKRALASENRKRKRKCKWTSDNVLRILICKTIEAEPYRGITVRIDDSNFLRWFTRIHDRSMMNFTTLDKLANCIQPQTWKKINDLLGRHAVENELIEGEKLRLDTTAVETNIHWPTDSSLLWDVYRVLASAIDRARELAPLVVGIRRLQTERAKKLYTKISRRGSRKAASSKQLKQPYSALIRLVEAILVWSKDVADGLQKNQSRYGVTGFVLSVALISELRHYAELGARVVDQARRRVLCGEQVPNDEKIFSIFEPHTELLKRGKAGKPIEFGHMVLIQQADGTFITDYRVFEKKPVEHQLIERAVKNHETLFGEPPGIVTADKGFYESMERIEKLEQEIELVAIGKKGRRSEEETERETDILFKMAQRFRAGIEGTISFLKRCLRLLRCFNKGLVHYQATVGLTVFAHNLLVLVRDTS